MEVVAGRVYYCFPPCPVMSPAALDCTALGPGNGKDDAAGSPWLGAAVASAAGVIVVAGFASVEDGAAAFLPVILLNEAGCCRNPLLVADAPPVRAVPPHPEAGERVGAVGCCPFGQSPPAYLPWSPIFPGLNCHCPRGTAVRLAVAEVFQTRGRNCSGWSLVSECCLMFPCWRIQNSEAALVLLVDRLPSL